MTWRSFLCFQIIRINLSQMLPLPRLSCRMPCRLTSVSVGNAYTTYAVKCSALSNHCHLKWDGLFLLTSCISALYGIYSWRAFLHASLSMVAESLWSIARWPYSGGLAAAPHARLLCCNILFLLQYDARDLVIDSDLLKCGGMTGAYSSITNGPMK